MYPILYLNNKNYFYHIINNMIKIIIIIIIIYIYYKILVNKKYQFNKELFTDSLNIWSEINTESKNYFHIKYDIPNHIIFEWRQKLPFIIYNTNTKELIISTESEIEALSILYLIYLNTNKFKTLTSILENNEINKMIKDISNDAGIKNTIINILNTNINNKTQSIDPLKKSLNIWSKINMVSRNYFHIKYDIHNDIIFEWQQKLPSIQYNINTKELIISAENEIKALAILYLIYLNANKFKTLTSILKTNEINKMFKDISNDASIKNTIINIINTNINNKTYIFKNLPDIWFKIDISSYHDSNNKYHIKYDIPNKKIISEWREVPAFAYNENTKVLIITGNENTAIGVLYLLILCVKEFITIKSIRENISLKCLINNISTDNSIKANIVNMIKIYMNNIKLNKLT